MDFYLIEMWKGITNEQWSDESFCINMVSTNRYALKFINNQTENICNAAIDFCPSSLQFVKTQTYSICMRAVKLDGMALQFVHKKTGNICMEAVKQNGYSLYYVDENISNYNNICEIAVKNCSVCLKLCKIQTEFLCRLALSKKHGWVAKQFIKDEFKYLI